MPTPPSPFPARPRPTLQQPAPTHLPLALHSSVSPTDVMDLGAVIARAAVARVRARAVVLTEGQLRGSCMLENDADDEEAEAVARLAARTDPAYAAALTHAVRLQIIAGLIGPMRWDAEAKVGEAPDIPSA